MPAPMPHQWSPVISLATALLLKTDAAPGRIANIIIARTIGFPCWASLGNLLRWRSRQAPRRRGLGRCKRRPMPILYADRPEVRPDRQDHLLMITGVGVFVGVPVSPLLPFYGSRLSRLTSVSKTSINLKRPLLCRTYFVWNPMGTGALTRHENVPDAHTRCFWVGRTHAEFSRLPESTLQRIDRRKGI